MARPSAAGDTFRAISDPTRRQIIDLLTGGPRSAGEIAANFHTCQSTVSEHLSVLRKAHLVTFVEHDGRRMYSLEPAPLREVATWACRWT